MGAPFMHGFCQAHAGFGLLRWPFVIGAFQRMLFDCYICLRDASIYLLCHLISWLLRRSQGLWVLING